jgi:hypothetical protein
MKTNIIITTREMFFALYSLEGKIFTNINLLKYINE